MNKFNTPILLIAWRRPEHLRQVIAALKKVKPKYIYAAVDGPRIGDEFAEERIGIEATKEIILNELDWDCEVKTLFRDENLGCAKGVSSAITWFFEHVEMGIIIEDDIVITENGLKFFEWGLQKFKDNKNIWLISGWNPFSTFGISFIQRYFYCWGWATWKRTWDQYSLQVPITLSKPSIFPSVNSYWKVLYSAIEDIDTWDYSMQFWMFKRHGKALLPSENYIHNVGFDSLGVHTHNEKNKPLFKTNDTNIPFKTPIVLKMPILLNDILDFTKVRNRSLVNLRLLRILKNKLS